MSPVTHMKMQVLGIRAGACSICLIFIIIDENAYKFSLFQGNILSWAETRDKWQLSNIEMIQLEKTDPNGAGHSKPEYCPSSSSFGNSNKHLVAFPNRRPVEIAAYTCKVHGGRLPVPQNMHENMVSSHDYPPASEASRELIEIRHKKISHTHILSTLWCL